MNFRKFLSTFLSLCLLSNQVSAATYIVNGKYPLASDFNTGKSQVNAGADGPWRSLRKANQTLVAGDTVFVVSLRDIDSLTNCGTDNSNCIEPNNSGLPHDPIVYWGVDSIMREPLNLPVLGNTRSTISKHCITIRGFNIQRGLLVNHSSNDSAIRFISVRACSSKNFVGGSNTWKFEAMQYSRLDSVRLHLINVDAGCDDFGFLFYVNNAPGGFSLTQPVSEQDTVSNSTIEGDSLRCNYWGMFFKFFAHDWWIYNNDIDFSWTTVGAGPGTGPKYQAPHGIINEESYNNYWYNNYITYHLVGAQNGNDNPRVWAQRSGSRGFRMQGNIIRVMMDSPGLWEFTFGQNSDTGGEIATNWDHYYGNHEQTQHNSWIDNDFYFLGPVGGGGSAGARWQTTAKEDSIAYNYFYAKDCVPITIDNVTAIGLDIEHNTIYSFNKPALSFQAAGATCATPFSGATSNIRYNLLFRKTTTGCTQIGSVIQSEGYTAPVNFFWNGFFSETGTISQARGVCPNTCSDPYTLFNGNLWVDPTFPNTDWPPRLTNLTNSLQIGPSPTNAGYIGATAIPIRPAPILDWAADPPTVQDCRMTWHATGSDSLLGTGSFYQVRFSLSPIITETDWNNASTVQGTIPLPTASGTAQEMLIETLSPGTHYYVAIRLYNWQNNPSELITTEFTTPSSLMGPEESSSTP